MTKATFEGFKVENPRNPWALGDGGRGVTIDVVSYPGVPDNDIPDVTVMTTSRWTIGPENVTTRSAVVITGEEWEVIEKAISFFEGEVAVLRFHELDEEIDEEKDADK